jgi:UDP-N-acetylmuramoyl-L-alanyl-D-glutamate--2,6-diaminopimelate ligase
MTPERISDLLELAQAVPGAHLAVGKSVQITGVAYDSRRVKPGDLFVAVPGFERDGHEFAAEAAAAGAAAIASEREVEGVEIPRLMVRSGREAMALISDAFYGHPSGGLALAGVTGTNGKTTTAFLIDAVLRAAGRTTGLMGTIHYRVGDRVFEAPRTSPEAPDLQFYLSEMREANASHAVMEVSSHALELGRVLGCEFAAAVFTNLTQDHLDFHGDMESYFRAKLRFFAEMAPAESIVNFDDAYGRRIAAEAAGPERRVLGYGLAEDADVRAGNLSVSAEGMSFDLIWQGSEFAVRTRLTGQHNVSNILAAAAACLAMGLSPEEVAEGIGSLDNVPGRFEKVDLGQPFLVVVDYAHTEDALSRMLEFARPVTEGRLLTLMGCGGDRDRNKRPLMAAAALRASDRVYMTSDNPRTEAPEAILREVEAGADLIEGGRDRSRVVVDRREAIREIIAEAGEGDTVVIAGKGHERFQLVGDERLPFDDCEEAREALRLLGYWR